MPVTNGFRDFVLDQLAGLGAVHARRMFGGVGLYLDEHFFGILADDALYLKADERNRPLYVRESSEPFRPYPDRPATMQYYRVPLGVLEDVDVLLEWAAAAVGAARRKSARRQGGRRRTVGGRR